MAREARFLYDHIIVTRDDALAGIVSVQRLLAAITDARVDAARHANPLTGLPGNALIERELRNRIRQSRRIALMHIDLDDFKAFNDAYGFHRGDLAIGMTAELLHDELAAHAGPHFLGHIGGDDFLAIVDGDRAHSLADRLRDEFQQRIASLYEAEDRRRGWICATDRTGENEIFPLMTLSVAMAFVEPHDSRHYAELLDDLSQAKRDTKSRKPRRLVAT
jgi:diguanylate cyclase (GGDEF)-like protein